MKYVNPSLVKKMAKFFEWYLDGSTYPDIELTHPGVMYYEARALDEFRLKSNFLERKLQDRSMIKEYNRDKRKRDRIAPPISPVARLRGAKLFLLKRNPHLRSKITL